MFTSIEQIPPEELSRLQNAYVSQARCKSRGRKDRLGNFIEMRMTFKEWLQVWIDSGKLHLRGLKKGCYVMSRKDDVGHYEIGNVVIQESGQNTKEWLSRNRALGIHLEQTRNKNTGSKRTTLTKERMRLAQRGVPKSRGHAEMLRLANLGKLRYTVDGVKFYTSIAALTKELGQGAKGLKHPNFKRIVLP